MRVRENVEDAVDRERSRDIEALDPALGDGG
jgi:hypothetical protein